MIKMVLQILKKRFFPSSSQKAMKEWLNVKGDETLRLNYPSLKESSIVFDLGGYKGQWASDIYSRYNCKIYVFETVKKFSQDIEKRFEKNVSIKSFNFGLSSSSRKELIFIDEDGSSLFGKGKKEEISLVEFGEFLKAEKIKKIELMKVNIEGAEYELIEYLIKKGLMNKIDNLQIQFHKNIQDYIKRYKFIRGHLEKTHKQTYYFPFIWENWKLKNGE